MSDTLFACFSGSYALERYPPTPAHEPLRAWDAADEYLLDAAAPLLGERPAARVLLVNDAFGALGVALHAYRPVGWGDSFTARLALGENLRRNGLSDSDDAFVPATAAPEPPPFDAVLWRVPKARALFEQQRDALGPLVRPDTLLLAGGMVKHLTENAKEVLAPLGSVAVLPVRKKAVLLRVMPVADPPPVPKSPPETMLTVPEYGLTLVGGPNVFARDKFDVGTRLLLEQFDRLPADARRIADLGCGNGLLGLAARRLRPDAAVHFFDESYQAIAAAEENARFDGLGDAGPAHFHVDDCLSHYAGEPFDLILCNPPFHQGHVVGDQTAWRMFAQSERHLRPGGELWVVGNRHLEYHLKLRRLFGNCRQLAAHPKFVALAATKG